MNNFVWKNGTGQNPVPLTTKLAHRLAEIIRDSKIAKDISGTVGFIEEVSNEDRIAIEKYITVVEMTEDLNEGIEITGNFPNEFSIKGKNGTLLFNYVVPTGVRDGYDGKFNLTNKYVPSTDKLDCITFIMAKGNSWCKGGIPTNLSNLLLTATVDKWAESPNTSYKFSNNTLLYRCFQYDQDIFNIITEDIVYTIIFITAFKNYIIDVFDPELWQTIRSYSLNNIQCIKEFILDPKKIFQKVQSLYSLKYITDTIYNGNLILADYSDDGIPIVISQTAFLDFIPNYVNYFNNIYLYIDLYKSNSELFNKDIKVEYDQKLKESVNLIVTIFTESEEISTLLDHSLFIKIKDTVIKNFKFRYLYALDAFTQFRILMFSSTGIPGGVRLSNSNLEKVILEELREIPESGMYGNYGYGYSLIRDTKITSLYLPNVERFDLLNYGSCYFTFVNNASELKEVIAPKINTFIPYNDNWSFIENAPKLEKLILGPVQKNSDFKVQLRGDSPNLIHYEFKPYVTCNLKLLSWNPTNALSTTANDLVTDYNLLDLINIGQDVSIPDFSSNKDLFLMNFKFFIADRLYDYSNDELHVLTLTSTVYNAINSSDIWDSKNIIQNKNWRITT